LKSYLLLERDVPT